MDLKATIVDIAQSLGFQRTVIGGLEPMEQERAEYEAWLAKGFAADMDYLQRTPHFMTSPRLLYPEARSVIIVSASYYTELPPDPGPGFGRVARYAVGLDYHSVLPAKLLALKERIEESIGRPISGKGYTDSVPLYEQGMASLAGLGFAGKNTLIIGPKLSGSYNFVAELFCDLDLEPDEPYKGTCGQCFRCGDICPTDAIVDAGEINAGLCISYLTIENKGAIPLELRSKLGGWVFGCDLCQEVCPYNQKPPETQWQEFFPQSGTGHYLNLLELLDEIAPSDSADGKFKQRFGKTPLSRPKRRGLLRNALVVLGNQKPDGALEVLRRFIDKESNPMLREHAAWAIAQQGTLSAKKTLESMIGNESDELTRQAIGNHIECMKL